MWMLVLFIEKLMAAKAGWKTGGLLTPQQFAAAVNAAWTLPKGYRITHQADPVRARQCWDRSRAIYRRTHSLQVEDVTIGAAPTVALRSGSILRIIKRA